MKKTFYMLLAAFGLCLFAGCGGSDDKEDNPSPLVQQLAGEWHLASWNGKNPDLIDAYVSFSSDGSFELYELIEEVYYVKRTGAYRLKDNVLSGSYGNNTSWNSSYEISFDQAGNTLTMVSEPALGEVSVYTRAAIPASVKGDSKSAKLSRSASRPLL